MTELQKIIMKAKYTLKDDISQEARNLLKGLMEKDPLQRLTISQILQHPWLQDAKDSTEVELFTDKEKEYIKTEFTYSKIQRYNRNFDTSGAQSEMAR
jgi:serine/threonine protein kinase